MIKELNYLAARVAVGKISRRAFLGRAGALGVSGAMANSLLSTVVQAAAPKRGGLMKAGLQGGESTNTLDPAILLTSVPQVFARCWGETLVEVSANGEIDYRIAESIEPSSDVKTWYCKIRQDIEFHNGKLVTVDDVHKTMQRHSGENTKSGALGIMRGIESMHVDGDILVINLNEPNADLPYLLSDYHLIIQPGGGIDAPGAGIGSGPYKVAMDEPGVRHGGERFENYWDTNNRGFVDQIEIIVINDSTARTAALRGKQVHVINRIEPKVANLIARLPGISIKNVAGRGHYVFVMHTNTPPFNNNDLRMALKLAINRKEMVDKILRGYGSIGNDTPINAGYPLFANDIEQREYDPDRAQYFFKKSGHQGPILLRTADGAFPGAVDAAQLFQQSAAKAGIDLQIRREPNDGYWTEVWNNKPFCTSYWGGRPVQDQMYSVGYRSNADWNDTRFFRPDFDALLIQAKSEKNLTKRKDLYRQMAIMVRNEGGAIVPMFNDFIDAISDQVQGYELNPNAELSDGYVLVKTWLA